MNTVTSKDGTTIAYDQNGSGPALILVGGALEQRAMNSETAQLATHPLLAQHFTVIQYDRRGRGDSGDTLPFALECEIEDIEALISAAGGSAYLFGISSGAALALQAAIKLGNSKVKKLAIYEAPYNDDAAARQAWKDYRQQLDTLLAQRRNADALASFMLLTGMPPEHLEAVRHHPMWPMWEAVAPTLAYDAASMGDEAAVPVAQAASLSMTALVMNGGASYPFMKAAAEALTAAMPHARHLTLEGQTHEVSVDVLAPVLVEFFTAD
jgi:pimeloyl-ACP methyl ester carboxylesterase